MALFGLSKASVPNVGAVTANEYTSEKPLHCLKALSPIVVTLFPIAKEPLKPEQLPKAQFPIEVTLLGIVKEPVKPEHL